MLKQVNGKWALVSRKTQRPLAYYKGEGKPSDEWVRKQEGRIEFFKHGGVAEQLMNEAVYEGNIGIMELVKFYQKATPDLITKVKALIAKKKNKEAWEVIQQTTGIKLHKSIHEEVKSDILPKAGAGQWGTSELVDTYKNATPGQSKVKSFKDYKK